MPEDLENTRSVLTYLLEVATSIADTAMVTLLNQLIAQYDANFIEPDISDKINLPYNRKDAYNILAYLKVQAEQLSDGRWSDFSDSDLGTVFLKLLSYLADMNNFQTDKVASELYINTALERASALALANLVGYEPRHYQSAYSKVTLSNVIGRTIPDGTIVPSYSVFTDSSANIQFCNLKEGTFYNNRCELECFQGTSVSKTYSIADINTYGRIILPDYAIGTNTIQININGLSWNLIEDSRFVSGDLSFSVHCSEDKYLYIQLPSYWPDLITQNSAIYVNYLISSGTLGRIGKDVLTNISVLASTEKNNIRIASNTVADGGYNPETVDEMRISVPRWASTMNTIVTINDFENVSMEVPDISDISALDYNDPASGLIQPDDFYKVYLYALPDAGIQNLTQDNLQFDGTTYSGTLVERQAWLNDPVVLLNVDYSFTRTSSNLMNVSIPIQISKVGENAMYTDALYAKVTIGGVEQQYTLRGASDVQWYNLSHTFNFYNVAASTGTLTVSIDLFGTNNANIHTYTYDITLTFEILGFLKYRNTVIKEREDWVISDMENVADELIDYARSSIIGTTITLTDLAENYQTNPEYHIIVAKYTGIEATSTMFEYVTDVTGITDRLVYSITVDTLNNTALLTFNSNWSDFFEATDKIHVYLVSEQVLTDVGQKLREYIDERRLVSLQVSYHDLTIVQPTIAMTVYMDRYNTNFTSAAGEIKDFILNKYSRKNLKIGEPLFASVIGADVLTNFNYVRYVEVTNPIEKIEVLPNGFIDVVANVATGTEGNYVLQDKITITVADYQNRIS